MAPSSARQPVDAPLAGVVREQDALLRVARAVAGGAEPGEVFALVAREVAGLFDAEAGIVWRFRAAVSEVVGAVGDHGSQLGVTFPLEGEGAVAVAARTGRPARASYRALPDADPTAGRVLPQGYTSGVAAPVRVGDRPWGAVLAATTGDRPLPTDAEDRIERFAELVSLAIANAQAREELATRASVDHLTGVPNRGEFHRRLAGALAQASRHRRPLSLVILDLDHFKRINDEAGHQAGDRVLRAAAQTIAAGVRGGDVLARVGGEEFALILPDADAGLAREVAERARLAVSRMRGDGLPPVTVSAGVADVVDAPDPDGLFAAADRALYTAKRRGRNRVERFSHETCGPAAEAAEPDGGEPLGGVRALAAALEARDPSTRLHAESVASLACRLAAAAGWGTRRISALRRAALLHDVGKVGVPDDVLLTSGPLTAAERDAIRAHPVIGAAMVAEVLGAEQASWVRGHHERFDGGGYPDGLAGEAIPDGARLIGVAEAFDVMTAGRGYARVRGAREALAEIRALAGAQFCPRAVELLVTVLG